jgi:hypothetical protein
LFSELAVCGTSEIHVGVDETMFAVRAFSGGVIFEKLDRSAALGAYRLKNGTWFPVLGVLSRAFHSCILSSIACAQAEAQAHAKNGLIAFRVVRVIRG